MPIPKQDQAREERITMEIIVDCYNESEAWSGWWCYLDGKLACPFGAECIRERQGSALKIGESVTVTGMLDEEEAADSLGEMQVEIEWQGRKIGVPFAQLRGVGASADTVEAIADWHYWVAQGRQFCPLDLPRTFPVRFRGVHIHGGRMAARAGWKFELS